MPKLEDLIGKIRWKRKRAPAAKQTPDELLASLRAHTIAAGGVIRKRGAAHG